MLTSVRSFGNQVRTDARLDVGAPELHAGPHVLKAQGRGFSTHTEIGNAALRIPIGVERLVGLVPAQERGETQAGRRHHAGHHRVDAKRLARAAAFGGERVAAPQDPWKG